MEANPGQDQTGRWKAAVAELHKQQRRQRVRSSATPKLNVGPGMIRRLPPGMDDDHDDGPAAA